MAQITRLSAIFSSISLTKSSISIKRISTIIAITIQLPTARKEDFFATFYEKNELLYLPEDTLTNKEQKALSNFSNNWSHTDNNNQRIHIVDPGRKSLHNKGNSHCKTCKKAQEILASKGYASLPDFDSIKKASQQFIAANVKEGVGSEHYIPLLYEGKFMPEESEWDILWFLADYKSNKQSTNFSILRFLYNYESDGENAAHDIFPFIKS